MRRIAQQIRGTCSALARSILAAALLFCVLAGAIPAEAAFNPYGVMPCCRGQKTAAGECHGNSCPMHRSARRKPARVVQPDPVCGAERLVQAIVRAPLPVPQDHSEHAQTHAEVEHEHGGSVSPRNTPQQPSAGTASLGKPCQSDCCGTAAGSLNGSRRPKQVAALTDGLRPRPPTAEPLGHTPFVPVKAISALRLGHPPRAPPAVWTAA